MKTEYTLKELVHINIDSWVNAISSLDDIFKFANGECPAEYEQEANAIAEKHNIRFNPLGEILESKWRV